MINVKLLKLIANAHGDRFQDLASALGMSYSSFYYRIHHTKRRGIVSFTPQEKDIIASRYGLNRYDRDRLFNAVVK